VHENSRKNIITMLNLQQEKIACVGEKSVINQGDQKLKKYHFGNFLIPKRTRRVLKKSEVRVERQTSTIA